MPAACASTTSTRARATRRPVLLLHGEPSWSYLYRKMIPRARGAGHRARRARSGRLRSFRQAGRARGLHLPASRRLDARVLVGARPARRDAGLPGLGRPHRPAPGRRASGALRARRRGQHVPADRRRRAGPGVPRLAGVLADGARASASGGIVQGRLRAAELPPEVVAAYDAPFPDERYKAGARQFPRWCRRRPDDPAAPPNRAAWEVLERWTKPFLTAFSDGDPVTPAPTRLPARASPARRDSRTPRSRAAATSCRRIAGQELRARRCARASSPAT